MGEMVQCDQPKAGTAWSSESRRCAIAKEKIDKKDKQDE